MTLDPVLSSHYLNVVLRYFCLPSYKLRAGDGDAIKHGLLHIVKACEFFSDWIISFKVNLMEFNIFQLRCFVIFMTWIKQLIDFCVILLKERNSRNHDLLEKIVRTEINESKGDVFAFLQHSKHTSILSISERKGKFNTLVRSISAY